MGRGLSLTDRMTGLSNGAHGNITDAGGNITSVRGNIITLCCGLGATGRKKDRWASCNIRKGCNMTYAGGHLYIVGGNTTMVCVSVGAVHRWEHRRGEIRKRACARKLFLNQRKGKPCQYATKLHGRGWRRLCGGRVRKAEPKCRSFFWPAERCGATVAERSFVAKGNSYPMVRLYGMRYFLVHRTIK